MCSIHKINDYSDAKMTKIMLKINPAKMTHAGKVKLVLRKGPTQVFVCKIPLSLIFWCIQVMLERFVEL